MNVMLVDFSLEAMPDIFVVGNKQVLDELTRFNLLEVSVVPDPDELVAKATAWAQGHVVEPADRIQFYSADEVPDRRQRELPDAKVPEVDRWRRQYSREEEAYCGELRELGVPHDHTPSHHRGEEEPPGAQRSTGSKDSRPCLNLTEALRWEWIARHLSKPCSPSLSDASTQKYVLLQPSL